MLNASTRERIRAAVAGQSGKVRINCPECDGNQGNTVEVNTKTGFFYCFRCKLKGYLDAPPAEPKTEKKAQSPKKSSPTEKARWIWDNSDPAPEDHAYLQEKGVNPHDLRIYKGSLAVALKDIVSGDLRSIQFINADGQKRLMKGGRKKGACGILGEITDDLTAPVCVCEGFATAASIHQATGYPAVMAVDSGNLTPVAKALKKTYPDKPLVFCADNDRDKDSEKPGFDEGWKQACMAARVVSGLVSMPNVDGQDFNDLLSSDGPEAVKAIIDAAGPPPKKVSTEPGGFKRDGRPEIKIITGRLHEAVDQIEKYLVANNEPIYSLGGDYLARPLRSAGGKKYGFERPAGCVVWAAVTVHYLIDLLSRKFVFLKFDGRREEWVPLDPPKKLAESLLSRSGLWQFPIVSGLAHCPLLRYDGTIIDFSGYDKKTGIYVSLNSKFPQIPQNPDRKTALDALARLRKALKTFPFDSQTSESVALSAMITAVMRPALDLSPLFMVTAPVAGSGKGLLVDGFSILGTGHTIPVSSGDEKPEELQAALESLLLEGAPMLSLDNLERPLKSSRLCQLLAQETLSIRVKGYSRTVRVSPSCLVFATGNNCSIAGDLNRRTVVITIDPEMERPETRKFDINFRDYVRQNRGNLVKDVVTIIRAYCLAGFPDQKIPPSGSFEMWTRWARAPLVWLGLPDPWASQETVRAEDSFLQNLKALMVAWHDVFKHVPQTTRDVISRAGDDLGDTVDLYDALMAVCGDRGSLNGRRLGKYLSKHRGRILGELQLQRQGTRQGVVKWAMVDLSNENTPPGATDKQDCFSPPVGVPSNTPPPSISYGGENEADL